MLVLRCVFAATQGRGSKSRERAEGKTAYSIDLGACAEGVVGLVVLGSVLGVMLLEERSERHGGALGVSQQGKHNAWIRK